MFCGMQTIKWGLIFFEFLWTSHNRGFNRLELYCTITIEAWLKLNLHFDCYEMHIYLD